MMVTQNGSIMVLSRIMKRKFRPQNLRREKPYPTREALTSSPTTHRATIMVVLRKKMPKGTLFQARG